MNCRASCSQRGTTQSLPTYALAQCNYVLLASNRTELHQVVSLKAQFVIRQQVAKIEEEVRTRIPMAECTAHTRMALGLPCAHERELGDCVMQRRLLRLAAVYAAWHLRSAGPLPPLQIRDAKPLPARARERPGMQREQLAVEPRGRFRAGAKRHERLHHLSCRGVRDADHADLGHGGMTLNVLSTSKVIFVFASVTSENQHFIGAREFAMMQKDTAFLLMSRAAVVDFPAMLDAVRSGHIRAATDVFPGEPVATDDPVRQVEGLILSAHRTGGPVVALYAIGRMAVADAELIMRGLPPQLCRRADPAIASRLRSKPVSVT